MSLERISIPTSQELYEESINLDNVLDPLAFTGRALFVSKFLEEGESDEVFTTIYGSEGYIKVEEFTPKTLRVLGIHIDIIENTGSVVRDPETPRYLTEEEGSSLVEDIRTMLNTLPVDRLKVQ